MNTPSGSASLGVRFWLPAIAAIFTKLALTSDLSVQPTFTPHDDFLYVERAYHLLSGDAFGPYDSRVLIKYPGMSFWLWLVRGFGIPYLFSISALYVAAGCYFSGALRRCGFGVGVVLAVFVLYLFNPVTLGSEWTRVLREPLATGLLVVLLAAMLHIAISADQHRGALLHALIFVLTFAFAIFVREEDVFLWVLLGLFAMLLAWRVHRANVGFGGWTAITALLAVGGAAVAALGTQHAIRSFVETNYGAPIIHEMSEGEFPRLLASIRSIESSKDNRMVMAPQDVLQKLRAQVPEFAPVINQLPPVGPNTFSCRLYHVCSEWANGWMPYWIKDAAFFAGLTPDLLRAQEYFRDIRLKIAAACADGRLRCSDKGNGLVPPMELRWTRAYVREVLHLVRLTFYPDAGVIGTPSLSYGVSVEQARHFQGVTMTDFLGALSPADFVQLLDRRPYSDPNAERMRPMLEKVYQPIAFLLLVFSFMGLIYRLVVSGRAPLDVFSGIAMISTLYLGLRLAALSYISVYFGAFDSRIVFSTYAVEVLLALPMIGSAVAVWRDRPQR